MLKLSFFSLCFFSPDFSLISFFFLCSLVPQFELKKKKKEVEAIFMNPKAKLISRINDSITH